MIIAYGIPYPSLGTFNYTYGNQNQETLNPKPLNPKPKNPKKEGLLGRELETKFAGFSESRHGSFRNLGVPYFGSID